MGRVNSVESKWLGVFWGLRTNQTERDLGILTVGNWFVKEAEAG